MEPTKEKGMLSELKIHKRKASPELSVPIRVERGSGDGHVGKAKEIVARRASSGDSPQKTELQIEAKVQGSPKQENPGRVGQRSRNKPRSPL